MGAAPRSVRLYFDEDADARLAGALRRRGYDVQTTAETGLLGASDEVQLLYAVAQRRVLVTPNTAHFRNCLPHWLGCLLRPPLKRRAQMTKPHGARPLGPWP